MMNFQLNGTNYVLEKMIGSGAYGSVGMAVDTVSPSPSSSGGRREDGAEFDCQIQRTQTKVAIKKVARAFSATALIKRTLSG